MRRRALFSDAVRDALRDDPISLTDVGARGQLEEPWRSLPPALVKVLGFEPDSEECERLNRTAPPGHRFLPVALWDKPGEVSVHVAEVPPCSSVHPPNDELLRHYRDEHARPRRTVAVERYPATTLDAALVEHGLVCDVLKVDTQGAEGEILRGAKRTLDEQVLCAVVETWTVEVHRGQALTGEVMELMADAGLTLFDVGVAAGWHRPLPPGVELPGKRQVIGLDLLFLRANPPPGPETRTLKLAAIADVYGFPDLALELLESLGSQAAEAVRDAVIEGGRPLPAARRGVRARLRRRPPMAEPEFANLHG
jgi:FkbM family methyltransferase